MEEVVETSRVDHFSHVCPRKCEHKRRARMEGAAKRMCVCVCDIGASHETKV